MATTTDSLHWFRLEKIFCMLETYGNTIYSARGDILKCSSGRLLIFMGFIAPMETCQAGDPTVQSYLSHKKVTWTRHNKNPDKAEIKPLRIV